MKVKEMVMDERPREKAWNEGVEVLSNRELLALLLRSGTKDKNVLELADELLHLKTSLGELSGSDINELMKIKGIKKAKAMELSAAFELSRRISFDKLKNEITIEHPTQIVKWLHQQIGYEQQECFIVLFLNQKNRIIKWKKMFVGTLTNAAVHPREIFKEAMRIGCVRIVCAHNHPSGDCSPSDADIEITKAIDACGKMISIPLLDHIIISRNDYCSLREMFIID